MQISPYLFFDGDAAEAIAFYTDALGGEAGQIMKFGDMPDHSMVPEDRKDHVAHGSVQIRSKQIMISDIMGHEPYTPPQGINIHTEWDTPEDARRVWDRLSEGGSVDMPLEQQFWARLFGGVTDKYGVSWMVSCT